MHQDLSLATFQVWFQAFPLSISLVICLQQSSANVQVFNRLRCLAFSQAQCQAPCRVLLHHLNQVHNQVMIPVNFQVFFIAWIQALYQVMYLVWNRVLLLREVSNPLILRVYCSVIHQATCQVLFHHLHQAYNQWCSQSTSNSFSKPDTKQCS